MSLKDITSPQDLAGKRVGTAGLPYQSAYLQTILRDAGVDPGDGQGDERRLQPRAGDALGQGRRDARGVLELRGRGPQAPRAPPEHPAHGEARGADLRRADHRRAPQGPRRELLLEAAALPARHRARPPAPARGPGARRRRPAEGRSGPRARAQTAVVSATLPVFFPEDKTKPFGWQEPEEWDAYGRWMYANKLLKRQPDAASALTNEFLPGQGLDPGTSEAP